MTDQSPAKAGKSAKPAQLAKPAQPAKPAQSANPVTRSKAAQPAKPQATNWVQSGKPVSSAKEQRPARPSDMLDPVHTDQGTGHPAWTSHLILFLRVMAGLSLLKGLYHWAQVCGIGAGPDGGFEAHAVSWQTATIFFAVFDLVAAVGLWLAAAWGAVVWLTSVVSMAVVELFFPQVFGGSLWVVLIETALLGIYLWLAIVSSRERPA